LTVDRPWTKGSNRPRLGDILKTPLQSLWSNIKCMWQTFLEMRHYKNHCFITTGTKTACIEVYVCEQVVAVCEAL